MWGCILPDCHHWPAYHFWTISQVYFHWLKEICVLGDLNYDHCVATEQSVISKPSPESLTLPTQRDLSQEISGVTILSLCPQCHYCAACHFKTLSSAYLYLVKELCPRRPPQQLCQISSQCYACAASHFKTISQVWIYWLKEPFPSLSITLPTPRALFQEIFQVTAESVDPHCGQTACYFKTISKSTSTDLEELCPGGHQQWWCSHTPCVTSEQLVTWRLSPE